jgi:hypothetical protein
MFSGSDFQNLIVMRFFLFFYFSIVSFHAQERFEVKGIGISIKVPQDWLEMKNSEILDNLNNYDFTEEQKRNLLSSNNSANELVTYYKYNPSKFNGIIPTIKIRTRNTSSKSIAEFLKFIEASNNEVRKTLKNFEYQIKPEVITLSGKKVVSFSVKFVLIHNGKEKSIVSKSYYVLKNGYYITINFIEEFNKENNEVFFNELINTIQLD